jgi:hypothetical protein
VSANVERTVAGGGVPPLLAALRAPRVDTQRSAVGALHNMAGHDGAGAQIVAGGGLAALTAALRSPDSELRTHAAVALCVLASAPAAARGGGGAAGALSALVAFGASALVTALCAPGPAARGRAVATLALLCSRAEYRAALVAAGALGALPPVLSETRDAAVREGVEAALAALA